MNKPEYRVRMVIYDERTDETVVKSTQPLYSSAQDILMQANDLQGAFTRHKDAFEEVHYPKDV